MLATDSGDEIYHQDLKIVTNISMLTKLWKLQKPVGLTKERGEKAKAHIYREIIDLVRWVHRCILYF